MSTSVQKTVFSERISDLQRQQEEQRLMALDPARSVWVSASAGSGKTTLLTQRVLRILLQHRMEGHAKLPNILCLTYTKAAAAEMQNRIHKQLADWAIFPEADLQARLEEEFAIKTNALVLKKARELFAAVLERQDALRIMTMHAFCQMVLNRFPHEAGLAPHFTLLEGQMEQDLQNQVLAKWRSGLKDKPELMHAFQILGATQSTSRSIDMLRDVFIHTAKWNTFFEMVSTPQDYAAILQKKLGLSSILTERDYLHVHCAPPHLDEQKIHFAVQRMQSGSAQDKSRAGIIAAWLENQANRAERFMEYAHVFLTKDGEIRDKIITKSLGEKYPELTDIMHAEAQRLVDVLQIYHKLIFYHQQSAYYLLARHLWEMAERTKRQRALLTYDDLIIATSQLLSRPDISPWILYKLDGGIDHILVDEAQDTSPSQWDIIFALLDEILSGTGARSDINRTLFVVGDEKQSIYSFQGASHSHYLKMKDILLQKFAALQKPMLDIERIQSFRSTHSVLSFVDAVFYNQDVRKGVSANPIRHFPYRQQRGLVELWPVIKTEKKPFPAPWHPPLERDDATHAYVKLAERIADTVHAWLSQGWLIRGRPIKPDDIIILLQNRSHLLKPIIRALKERGVPVAGIDVMVLCEQPAVQDVLAICRFLLLPQDDLTLAEVLRGPLIRLTDEQLLSIAYGRDGTLWHALQKSGQEDAYINSICNYLKTILGLADTVSSFALLCHIYSSPCPAHAISGKSALVHRLGIDAIDPLEQLLTAARLHDETHPISLQLFVRSVANDESALKREQSEARGEIRIMTTHGAKGLEAPIIFMPDLMRDPFRQGRAVPLVWSEDGFAFAAIPVAKNIDLFQNAKTAHEEAKMQEHRRLLYVALTRAADVLICCSAVVNKEPAFSPWFTHITSAMQALEGQATQTPNATSQYGDADTLTCPYLEGVPYPEPSRKDAPAWLSSKVAYDVAGKKIYNPSQLMLQNEAYLSPGTQGAVSSLLRGSVLHRLFQFLPLLPDAQREDAARRFISRYAAQDQTINFQDVCEVMAVLRHPVFADVFSPIARAEVPVIGRINGKTFSGQIDRMLVNDNEVLLVDFKTNRPPPSNLEQVDGGYLAQMACYTTLLGQIYPHKTIRAGLLWTHTLLLMELDEAAQQRGMQILSQLA